MCGIAGTLKLNGTPLGDAGVASRMASLLVHRGPDDEGHFAEGPVSLGFRRLSIIDINTGRQPMSNEDGTIWIVFNGEIYNYIELREQLLAHGHTFATKTDTEVIVHAYESFGADFVKRLRGMFGLAIWDGRTRQLLLARDAVGKKPLYYSVAGGELAFASEMKALLAWPGLNRSLDPQALDQYLSYLYVPGPASIFKSVRKLPPGHVLVADCSDGSTVLTRYWAPDVQPDHSRPFGYWVQGLRSKIEESVRLRLRSDVPLGSLLSGGIDSSIVSAVAARSVEGLRTFGIGFADPRFDESSYAKAAAHHFGTIHTQDTVDASTFSPDDLSRLVWHADEPFADSSFLPTYWVCTAARRHVTVALSGDGGDELFGGYTRYRHFQRLRSLSRCPSAVRWVASRVLSAAPPSTRLSDKLRQFRKALALSGRPLPEQVLALHSFFREEEKRALYADAWAATVDGTSAEAELAARIESISHAGDDLALIMAAEFTSTMVDDSLVKLDRASMACSLEVRCPLLDQDVAEFAMRIPPEFKMRRGGQKIVLKRAFEDMLPRVIRERGKQGFEVPFASWFQRPQWRNLIIDTLSQDSLRRQGIFDATTVVKWRDRLLRDTGTPSDISAFQLRHRVWGLLVFQLWFSEYMAYPGHTRAFSESAA